MKKIKIIITSIISLLLFLAIFVFCCNMLKDHEYENNAIYNLLLLSKCPSIMASKNCFSEQVQSCLAIQYASSPFVYNIGKNNFFIKDSIYYFGPYNYKDIFVDVKKKLSLNDTCNYRIIALSNLGRESKYIRIITIDFKRKIEEYRYDSVNTKIKKLKEINNLSVE